MYNFLIQISLNDLNNYTICMTKYNYKLYFLAVFIYKIYSYWNWPHTENENQKSICLGQFSMRWKSAPVYCLEDFIWCCTSHLFAMSIIEFYRRKWPYSLILQMLIEFWYWWRKLHGIFLLSAWDIARYIFIAI